MATKKFTKYTKGRNQQVIVPKAIAITTDATLALFLSLAPTGEIGVYDGVDALHTESIDPGESFYIIQKRSDGSIRKTNLVAWNDVTVRRKAYVAPVKCVGSLGWAGTAGALNLAAAVASGKLYELAILETTEGNQPFPTWNYEYQAKPGDVELDVLGGLAKMINDSANIIYKSNAPLVTAEVKADATYTTFYAIGAGGTLTVTNGSTSVVTAVGTINFVIGDFVAFAPSGPPSDSVGSIYKIVGNPDANTWTLNRAYTGATQTFVEAEAEGTRVIKPTAIVTTGLVLTAINNEESFRIVARQELVYASIVNQSAYARGNGTSDRIAELELEGNAFAGNTAGNTIYGNEGYGNPDKFVTDGETYDTFNIEANVTVKTAGSPNGWGKQLMSIVIAAPKSAGGLSAALNTLFGT